MNLWLIWFDASDISPMKMKFQKFGNAVRVVDGAAFEMNFDAAFVLLAVARHFVTMISDKAFLRHVFFPCDKVFDFCIMTGVTFVGVDITHTVIAAMLMVEAAQSFQSQQHQQQQQLQQMQMPQQQQSQQPMFRASIVTGKGMLMCLIVACSTLGLRHAKQFNTFCCAHHLLIVSLVMMCIHDGKTTIQPFQSIHLDIAPLLVSLMPRPLREIKCTLVKVKDAKVYAANNSVLELLIEKPENIKWQNLLKLHVHVNISMLQMSKFKWHPMTMSTSDKDKYLGFCIQCAGD